MIRVLVLPLLLGVAIALAAVGTYWILEALLVNVSDYNRGLWEGAALVVIMNGGNALANSVLKRFDATKKEQP